MQATVLLERLSTLTVRQNLFSNEKESNLSFSLSTAKERPMVSEPFAFCIIINDPTLLAQEQIFTDRISIYTIVVSSLGIRFVKIESCLCNLRTFFPFDKVRRDAVSSEISLYCTSVFSVSDVKIFNRFELTTTSPNCCHPCQFLCPAPTLPPCQSRV